MISSPNRRNSDSVKWGVYAEDVLPLWVADMDFVSPPAVIEALHKRVEHGVFGYAFESRELKSLIVQRMKARYDWQITSEDVLLIPGVITGLNLVSQAVVKPGESILVQPPVYPPFFTVPANCGAETVCNDLIPGTSGHYEVDYADFERRVASGTRCFLLCNPHNPVGRAFRETELRRMAEICLPHRVIICSDEIHSDLVFSESRHIPIASLGDEIAASTITLIAPSKTFNIAGLDCAALICTNPDLRERIKNARRGLVGHVNLLGMSAAAAAYRDGESWLAEVLSILESNRNFLMDYLGSEFPEIRVVKPEATYLAWLDCTALALPESPFEFFLKDARVALNQGLDFGEPGRNHVRLNFGCPRATLEEALDRMCRSIKKR